MSDQELMSYFKFDETDRLANQAGQISAKQKVRFIAEDRYNKKWGRIGGIFMLVSAALGLALMAYAWIKASGNISMIVFDLIAGGIWILLWGIIGAIVLARLSSRPEFKIARVQGHARIVDVQSSYANNRIGTHQELHIGGKRFVATRMLAGRMPEADYIVYYFDRPSRNPSGITYPTASEDILSVELFKKADATAALEPLAGHEAEDDEIIRCIKEGDVAGAIRRHRSMYNSSLEEARKSVEIVKASLGN
jgi:hypothetical protein